MHTSILPVCWGHITLKDITETSDWACGSHISMVLTETGKAFSLWEPCFGCWGLYPLMGLREITCFIYFLFLFFPISLIHIELSSCKINALLHLVLWFPGAVLGKVELLKRHIPPCLVWLSGLSAGLWPKGSLVWFLVRTHAWVAGQVPSMGHKRQPHIDVSLPPFLSL